MKLRDRTTVESGDLASGLVWDFSSIKETLLDSKGAVAYRNRVASLDLPMVYADVKHMHQIARKEKVWLKQEKQKQMCQEAHGIA
jgi:hypothetical protein